MTTPVAIGALLVVLDVASARAGSFYIGPAELPWAIVDRPYTPPPLVVTGGARCPNNNMTVGVVDGLLPEGIELYGTGQFAGTPRNIGTYRFLVRAANSCGQTVVPFVIFVTGAPVLAVSPTMLEFHYRRGDTLAAPQFIEVRSTWPRLAYSVVTEGADWLSAIPKTGRTPSEHSPVNSDVVEVKVDSARLLQGKYTASLRFWTWDGANAPTVEVRFTVEPAASECNSGGAHHEHDSARRSGASANISPGALQFFRSMTAPKTSSGSAQSKSDP